MTEQEFQNEVTSIADQNGWLWFHHPYEDGLVRSGWPDLVLVHPRRKLLLFRELKRERGPLTHEQSEFLYALQAVGADAKIWKPKDWDEIVKVLEDDSDYTQETQEAQEIFNNAYKESREIYEERKRFKEIEDAYKYRDPYEIEADIGRQAFNKADKAAKVTEAFNKAFQDYEVEKEVREANKAYEAFNKAYEAFNKAEIYKAAKVTEERAKSIEEAAEKAFYQAREEVDKTKKVAKKADKNDGESFNKYKNAAVADKKAKEAFSTEASETTFNEALAAEEALHQAKEARSFKKAEADKYKKAADKKAKEAEEAKAAFYRAKGNAEKAALRTRKAEKAVEKAAADAGLNIEIIFNWLSESRLSRISRTQ